MSQINLDNLTEEQKKKIVELNNLRQSFEFINSQRMQIESSQRETEAAIEELEKIQPENTVYKSIGGILVKSDRNKLLDEKKSLKISIEMRLKTLKQKEERVKNQLETMSKSLQADFQK
ncbi:MAG: prefoldin subunit beta [Candidatus Thorarchaeota archaeon]